MTADLQPLSTVLKCVGAQEAQLRETRRGPALRQLPLASPPSPPPKDSPLGDLTGANPAAPVSHLTLELDKVIFRSSVVYAITSVTPLEPSGEPALSASSRKGKERRRSQKVGAAAQAHEQVGQRGSESRVDCALIRRVH